MSSFYSDLSALGFTGVNSAAYSSATQSVSHTTDQKAGMALDMTDFLQLMVATVQNQTIDNTADISDMMNQMVQMSVVETLTNLTNLITESTNLTYAASLVGKDVVIGQASGNETKRISGTVTASGMMNGQPVVFLGEESYWLSDILAVGTLPLEEEDNAVSLLSALDEEAEIEAEDVEPGLREQELAVEEQAEPEAVEESVAEDGDEEIVEEVQAV